MCQAALAEPAVRCRRSHQLSHAQSTWMERHGTLTLMCRKHDPAQPAQPALPCMQAIVVKWHSVCPATLTAHAWEAAVPHQTQRGATMRRAKGASG